MLSFCVCVFVSGFVQFCFHISACYIISLCLFLRNFFTYAFAIADDSDAILSFSARDNTNMTKARICEADVAVILISLGF
jgi:hypothetical protein